MSLADELLKLDQLRERGSISMAEFERAKARLLEGDSAAFGDTGAFFSKSTTTFWGMGAQPSGQPGPAINRLRRSTSHRWVGGVCGGLAQATQVDAWVWRLLFAASFFVGGVGILLYALMWIFVPAE